jgi:predicted Rdx family selenoprotein
MRRKMLEDHISPIGIQSQVNQNERTGDRALDKDLPNNRRLKSVIVSTTKKEIDLGLDDRRSRK